MELMRTLLSLLQPSDYPQFLKAKLKAFTIESLPRSVSRSLYGHFIGKATWEHRKGSEILACDTNYNDLTDEGEQDILETFYLNQSVPVGDIYMGLATSAISDASNLSNITEVTGSGYVRKTIARSSLGWPTRGIVAGNWLIQSSQQTFTASGAWTAAEFIFLSSVISGSNGRLWNFLPLSAPRSLNSGESFNVIYSITLN